MGYDEAKHHRRSVRLEGYDYAQAGVYFLTVCTFGRACLFGDVVEDAMRLSALGRIAEEEWLKTPGMRPEVELDAYVVMPNHLHAVVLITADGVSTRHRGESADGAPRAPRQREARSLGSLVAGYKAVVTGRARRELGWDSGSVWQRSYFEHIIRTDRALDEIRVYIEANPWRWAWDDENPAAS
jgi:REP element-mobilizing transposase RayT